MTRGRKIAATIAASLAGLLIVALVAGMLLVRSQWFHDLVRGKIVTAVENATGGKVEIAAFRFDWRHLRAQVHGLVIHGSEPPTAQPLLRANLVQIDLKLLSPFRGFVDLAYLLVDTPQADIIVYPDGHTNIPAPKIQRNNGKTVVENIVDLAIGRFDLRNGTLLFADRQSKLNANGANLRAQLAYNALLSSYTGEIDISPLYFQSGANPPFHADVKLPVTMEKDKITLTKAQLRTPHSQILISGSVDHLLSPRASAHLNATLALDEWNRALGLALPLDTVHGPRFLSADVTASLDNARIQIQSAHASLGRSNMEASGTLPEGARPGSLQFRSTLVLGEIGPLFRLPARPEGTVKIGGNADLLANRDYKVTAGLDGRGIAIHPGSTRISGVSMSSALEADPRSIRLSGLRVAALGGEFTGAAAIRNLTQFHVAGNLQKFEIARTIRAFLPRDVGYDGIVSGPVVVDGSVRDAGALVARANLGIAPASRGIPVSGHIVAAYNGRAGVIDLGRSRLALPHTVAEFSGSLGRSIQVRLVTRNFADFRPLAVIPVTFTGSGAATVDAVVTGSLSAPRVAGQASVTNFAVNGRPFTHFAATVDASPSSATVTNAVLSRGALQAQFSATAGLRNWKPANNLPFTADLSIRNADLRDALAAVGHIVFPATGDLQADAHIAGTIGSPIGNAELIVAHGTIGGEPFDSLAARAILSQIAIDVPAFRIVAGPSRIDAALAYRHAVNDLQRGVLTAHVASNQVQLARFQSLVKDRPGFGGDLNFNGDLTAAIAPGPTGTEFQLSALRAAASLHNLAMDGKSLGDLTATAASTGSALHYDVNSNFAGSTIRISGQSQLAKDLPTSATASISNLPIDRVLAVAGRHDLPLKGTLTANAVLQGPLQAPHGSGSLTIANGSAFNEPFTRIEASATYTDVLVDVPQLRVEEGPSNLELSATFHHPAGDLQDGQLQFHAASNQIQLSRLHTVANARPGLAGLVRLTADGAATLHRSSPIAFSNLNAQLSARSLSIDRNDLGSLNATAALQGNSVALSLDSDLVKTRIHGAGRLDLAAGYPLDAQITFTGATWSALRPFLVAEAQPFDASLDGEVHLSGPIERLEAMRGSLQITKLDAHSVAIAGPEAPQGKFELHNVGNILASLDNSVVTVQNFHVAGSYTDVALSGTISIRDPKPLGLRATGNVKLDILQAFSHEVVSSGAVALTAVVSGSFARPQVNGRLQLQNASLNLFSLPNGLSKANGTINFNGSEAVFDNVTGETGGGKITLAGFVGYAASPVQFRIQATAAGVRINYPDAISTEANARLSWVGTVAKSLLSGNVTVLKVAMRPTSDVGSILTSAATPPPVATASRGLAAGMRFDVRIRTASTVQFRTSLTENLQADADLHLRGSPDHPGVIGRIVVNSGDVIFFGAKYTIDQGTLSFFNPNEIAPVLNLALETTVQGVDVTVNVSGPLDKLKLTYRSDPPLEFQQLVALLASGTQPTTDPVLAAHQPAAPQQNFQQLGASAILGQAVANPVSDRLQRLFGVTRLSINPQMVGYTTNDPQATVTLQQQVTRDITFTYIHEVTTSNPTGIRIEWAISPQFSAVAQRDIYGEFGLSLFFKKRFH